MRIDLEENKEHKTTLHKNAVKIRSQSSCRNQSPS